MNKMRSFRKRDISLGRIYSVGIVTTLIGLLGPVSRVNAEIANALEPEYSLAVLDFNDQKFDSALRILKTLQKQAPKTVEFLELKAITYKAMKNTKGAALTYGEILQLKSKDGKEKKESAPYAFELGVIRYNEKRWKEADQYLNFSVKYGFNVDVARFYLGLTQIQIQAWKKAEFNLKQVLKGNVEELKPAAHYYLAQVYFKLGASAQGFGNLIDSQRSADRFVERADVPAESKKVAEQVKTAVAATLAPFDKSQLFGNFSLLLGYDSNALLVPSDGVTPTDSSGKSTLKTMVSAGLGYASSPMKTIQWVPSARFNLNKNFNSASSSSEFADTTLSLYLTKDALAPLSIGLKTEGTFVFQNQTETSGSKKYHLYNTALVVAPYVKWDASKNWTYNVEAGYRTLSFNSDDTLAESLRRSGPGFVFKVSAADRHSRRFFNPIYVVRMESNSTQGSEYRSSLLGAQFINTMKLSKIDFAQVFSIEHTAYDKSSTNRVDTLMVLSLLATRKIGPRWAVAVSGDLTKNNSSDKSSFSYDRYTLNSGVSYNF